MLIIHQLIEGANEEVRVTVSLHERYRSPWGELPCRACELQELHTALQGSREHLSLYGGEGYLHLHAGVLAAKG